jgi:hypothetical protein
MLSDSRISYPYYSGGKYTSHISPVWEINYLKRHDRLINYRISLSFLSRNFDMVASDEEHFYTRIIDANFKLRYISFAFLPEIALGKRSGFYFNLGPCMDLLVHGNQSGSNYAEELYGVTETSFSTRRTNYQASDVFSKFLIGLKCGIRFDYPLTEKLVLQFKTNFTCALNNFTSGENAQNALSRCKDVTCLAGVCYYFK